MKPWHHKVMAHLNFFVFGLCATAGIIDLMRGQISPITTINLCFAAANLWLGIIRMEAK